MSVVIKLRRGTSTEWNSSTIVLAIGEVGLETNTSRIKIGNGTSLWNALPYSNVTPAELAELAQDAVGQIISVSGGITKNYDDAQNAINLGIDTSIIATEASLSLHNSDTTNVHGIADTAQLATKSYADTAASNAQSAAATALSSHESDTTNIHGISDTSQLATKSYADLAASSAVAAVIDSAPSTLNTLNELAAALADDANYASTITTALGQKASLTGTETLTNKTISGGTINGTVYADGATISWTGSPITFQGAISGTDLTINDATLFNTEFTGNVDGLTKGMVGLNLVDNTSDVDKPISTEVAAALNTINISLDQKSNNLSTSLFINSTAYTVTSSDMFKRLEFSSSSPITVTLPSSGTENIPTGSSVELLQVGTGKITVQGESVAVSIYGPDNQFKSRVQWSSIFCEKRGSNSWLITGDTEA